MEGVGSLRLPEGCRCETSVARNFDYFSPIPVESAQKSQVEIELEPANGLSSTPFTFTFQSDDESFLSLGSIYMYCRAQVVNSDGSTLSSTDMVAPVNNLLHSMWSKIETRVNGVEINAASATEIPYKAMMETLLSVEGTNNHFLRAGMFYQDTAKLYDANDETNLGFKARKFQMKADSHLGFSMCGPVCSDFLRSDNHLAPGNTLTLSFERMSNQFCLLSSTSGKDYKLIIHDIRLYGRRIKLYPEAFYNVMTKSATLQRYMSTYSEVKEYPVRSGIKTWSANIFSTGSLPKQIIVGMVDTDAKQGSLSKNPFNFKHNNLSQINLKINGTRVPQEALKPDFTNNLIMRTYQSLFLNTGKNKINSGNCISVEDFVNGCALFPFDLTPDQCNMFHTHAGHTGSMELEIKWDVALPVTTTIVVYAASDQAVMLKDGISPVVAVF